MVRHSSILVQKIPWIEKSRGGYSPGGHKESDTIEHQKKKSLINHKNIVIWTL